MIYLAITAEGVQWAIQAATSQDAVWCGCDAISDEEYAAINGVSLSRFVYALGDHSSIVDALATIEEHHPGQPIWVEAAG